jgi:hypothetical protein
LQRTGLLSQGIMRVHGEDWENLNKLMLKPSYSINKNSDCTSRLRRLLQLKVNWYLIQEELSITRMVIFPIQSAYPSQTSSTQIIHLNQQMSWQKYFRKLVFKILHHRLLSYLAREELLHVF